MLQNISTFILILALIIGFLVSGIFSDEFQAKADSIFFSSKLGRNKAILSKMGAGFLITSVFYIVFVLLYTFIVLWALGADGANCPIQLDLWRSIYNITFFQAYLLIAAGGYIGTLFASTLSMLVSAAARSTATAIIVPFILLCAFPFFEQDHYIASDLLVLPGPAARGIYLHQRLRTGGNRRQGNGYRRGNPSRLSGCLPVAPACIVSYL
ncbi:MAG: hypothetical protein ACLSFB_14815 [[Clostridium] scindens]